MRGVARRRQPQQRRLRRRNLAAERPADVAALRAELTAWLEAVGAQLPRPYAEIPAGELPGTKRR